MNNIVLETEQLTIGLGRFRKSIGDFSVQKGELVHIKGPNGSGKSTLLKTIAGKLSPIKGDVRSYGKIVYVPQHSESEITLPLTLGEWLECFQVQVPGQMIHPDTLKKRWRDASGGERQKVSLLARIHSQNSILLLDEPFNHVDETGKEETENFIADLLSRDFLSAVVIISHQSIRSSREIRL